MLKKLDTISGPIAAFYLACWMLGLVFLMAGWWKVFTLTPMEHAAQFFVQGFKDHWIPVPLLWALGVAIPILELLAGLALIIGLWPRLVAACCGLLLLLTTYGHSLQQPLFDIDGHTFTRFILVLFVLILPSRDGCSGLMSGGFLAPKNDNKS